MRRPGVTIRQHHFDDTNAACKDKPAEWFFPQAHDWVPEVARSICEGCPIKDACRDFAVNTNQEYGIWGGTSPEDRRKIRRQRRRSIPGSTH